MPRSIDLGSPVSTHPLNRGLIAWLTGVPGRQCGNVFHDISGRGYNGVLTSGPLWRPEPSGRMGLIGDGTNDYVSMARNPTDGLTQGTFEAVAWTNTLNFATHRIFDSLVDANGYGVRMTMDGSSASADWEFTWKVAFGDEAIITAGAGVTVANVWQHFVGTCRSDGAVRLYVNGRVQADTGSVSGGALTAATLSVMKATTAGDYLAGRLGGLSFWNRGVEDSEAWLLYREWRQGYPNRLRRRSSKRYFIAELIGGTQTATPNVGTVALTAASPAASGTGTGTGTPNAAAVAIAGVDPSGSASGSVTATPGSPSVTLTGTSPAASAAGSSTVTPDAGIVTISSASPSASGTGTGSTTPGAATVSITGVSPAGSGTGTATATPASGTIALSGADPTATATGAVAASPGFGIVAISGVNVSATGGGTQTATAGAAIVSVSATSPAASGTGIVTAAAGFGDVAIAGVSVSATPTGPAAAAAGVASITLLGFAPSISATGIVTLSPGVGVVTISGHAPAASGISDFAEMNPTRIPYYIPPTY